MGANRTFSVSVQTTKPKSISVKSNISQNEIGAKGDTSLYYSELAKDWAIGDGLIQGKDYSSKTYAQTAFEYAEQGKVYLDGSTEIYANLQQSVSDNITTISGIKEEAIAELENVKNIGVVAIETAQDDVLTTIDAQKNSAIGEINATIETVMNDIDAVETVADNITVVSEVAENLDDILNKTVEVGDTLTSEAGTKAKVVNVGTKYAPVLEFTIPQGANGVDGKVGKDGADGGMSATFEAETQTLSFSAPVGVALYPEWGYVQGDINNQVDLKTVLDGKQDKGDYALKEEIPSLDGYVKNTDYATAQTAGVFKVENGIAITQQGYISAVNITLEKYKGKPNYWIMGKGTLENVLTQYSKTVLTTEADYNALETKDANTLYLIEE